MDAAARQPTAIVITLIIYNAVYWTYVVAKDLLRLIALGLIEALWCRPAMAWWRLKATVLALIGRRPGWGVIPRGEGILEVAAQVVGPLTR